MTSCARCAPRTLCWGRCWRAMAMRWCRCPAAAPSARGRWICTSTALEALGAEIELRDGYLHAKAPERAEGRA